MTWGKLTFVLCSVKMGDARMEVGKMGVKLLDAGPNLLDLRFAEDVLLFAEARWSSSWIALVCLIPDITAKAGVIVQVLPRDGGQKWLGSVLTSRGSKLEDLDLQHHLEQASKVFHMNRWILQERNGSIVKRFRHFESVTSSMELAQVNCQLSTWRELDT